METHGIGLLQAACNLLVAIISIMKVFAGGRQSLKHRRVKHYGYEFLYDTNNVDLDCPLNCGIPAVCDSLIDQLISDGHLTAKPDQLTVNSYQPGQGMDTLAFFKLRRFLSN